MSSEHAEAIARRIEELRIKRDIERRGLGTRLSEITGVTRKAANKWLNGENAPKADHIRKIAQFFNVNTSWLEYGEERKPLNQAYDSLSMHSTDLGHVDVYESLDPLHPNEVEVPFFTEVELSAGNGFNSVSEIATQQMRFNLSTLSSAGVAPSKAACCKVSGDSMEPVLPDGSTVGLDTADTVIKDGKMYAINHGGMLRVKYLYRMPFNGLRIRSANTDYQDEEVSGEAAKDIRIIGRVFWYSVVL
ncbi:helix-turn-helix transcriptional regulator [Marinomonas hwangdonensis]|uniref:Helix-turn-helix transcriptional regulator n=1 Tax=Marinomonas hwangdonensis TaxID=1053647 RepID=A0A3M8QA72_9GAMM|nr:helix-turn-helix transcriptional regulator [Marinomonas hwangdonensis]RNF52968.1 helix-turn-helix transcriptional regulator [Marinomonas hwangdonensis]